MTAQIGEKLHYEGCQVGMCTEPLGDYFALAEIKPSFDVNCTALWRGYIGTWEILAGRLYLIGLSGTLTNGADANLATVFPGFPDRVLAHWYTGTLRVPQGKLLEYKHRGYSSSYESDLFITVVKGIVTTTHVQHNGTSPNPPTKGEGHSIGAMTVFAKPQPGSNEDAQ